MGWEGAAQLLISGIVQGVGYRYWTQKTATRLGLSGWVRNLYDGRVEVYVEGEVKQIDQLHQMCRHGPRSSEVQEIQRRDRPTTRGLKGFAVHPDSGDPEP